MERISAASNLIIEVQPESWRLLVNGNENERVLVEAVPGEPLRYGSTFGSRRHLPDSGILPREDIQSVVLGWSEKDDAWHLGLVLKGDLVDARGSRWCGLAHWHDPLANQYLHTASQAGQTLAQQIARPFTVIPPHGSEGSSTTMSVVRSNGNGAVAPISVLETGEAIPTRIPVTTMEPAPEPIPQPELPLQFDLWTLRQADATHLIFELSPAWGRSKLLRTAWNIIWLGVFIILVVTTLISGIALPRPEFLVYLGIVSIIVLTLIIVYNLYDTATHINRIVFEKAGVRWLRGKRVRKAIPVDQIQEVYVSHVVTKVTKRGKGSEQRGVQYGELNLLLKNGKFQPVLVEHQTDEIIPVTDDPLNEETVAPLTIYTARTHLQSAALKLANLLGVSVEYDKRLR
jgi:hypothetical protein